MGKNELEIPLDRAVMIADRVARFAKRKYPNKSLQWFAEAIGYKDGSSIFSLWKKGNTLMTLPKLIKAGELLGIHPAALLTEHELSDEAIELLSDFLKLLTSPQKHEDFCAIQKLIKSAK